MVGLLDPSNAAGYAAEAKRLAVNVPNVTPMDAARFVAEATPIIGDAMAAKQVWDEATSVNPNWALVGALGGATVLGLFPFIGDAAANAVRSGARGLLDTAKRVEVGPNSMGSLLGDVRLKPKVDASPKIKADLDPLGYQNTKMRDYLSNTDVALTDTGENLARKPMSWEETEGKVVLPFYGDRTSRGLLVEGVDDVKFDQPVYTEGGVDFMLGPAAQADNAVWASNQNIVTRIDNEANKAREKFQGKDILGVTGSMSPNANDFATMTGAAMAELVKGSKITKKAAKSFDKEMKSFDPDFVGVLSPDLRKWAENTIAPNRKSFIRLIDTKPYQELGFPSSGQARYSVTDPTQRDMPAGMFGLGAARIGDLNPVLFKKPRGNMPPQSFPHSTYNTQITGDYLGSLPPVPQGLLFSDVYKSMAGKTTKSGQPLNEAHKTHAIKTKMPAQVITPEVLEGILSYLSRMER